MIFLSLFFVVRTYCGHGLWAQNASIGCYAPQTEQLASPDFISSAFNLPPLVENTGSCQPANCNGITVFMQKNANCTLWLNKDCLVSTIDRL